MIRSIIWIPILLLTLLLSSASAQQQVTLNAQMAFTAPIGLNTPQAALSVTYKHYIDGASSGTVFVPTCALVSGVVECQSPLPALTAGSHTIQITATNIAGESNKIPSPALAFITVIVPAFSNNGNFRLVISSSN